MALVNHRPMNIWLYAKCRKYVDPDNPEDTLDDAEGEIAGEYADNPTGLSATCASHVCFPDRAKPTTRVTSRNVTLRCHDRHQCQRGFLLSCDGNRRHAVLGMTVIAAEGPAWTCAAAWGSVM